MRQFMCVFTISLMSLSACTDNKTSKNTNNPKHYDYPLMDINGNTIGQITITDTNSKAVALNVKAENIKQGAHGIHFHETGSCIWPDFKSAGGHINPDGKAHGLNNPDGPDNADMPNAVADAHNRLKYDYINTRLSIHGTTELPALLDENGSALVIHAYPDDGITQPIGGAGPRIACAAIR